MRLKLEPNVVDADGIYEALIRLHEGRSEEDSAKVNSKLVLILINHIGDREAVDAAIRLAEGRPN